MTKENLHHRRHRIDSRHVERALVADLRARRDEAWRALIAQLRDTA